MVDVKSFLVALKITWLKRILSNDGKILKNPEWIVSGC